MKYISLVLIVVIGSVFGLVASLMLLETRKKGMDQKDKKGNIYGSIFLFIVSIILILGGVSVWLSSKTVKNEIESTAQKTQNTLTQEAALPVKIQEQPQQTQEQIQAQRNTKKQEAEKAVKSFTQLQKNFSNILTSYQSEIKDISNGTIDAATYNDLDKLGHQAQELFRNVKNMDIAHQYANEKQIMVTAVLYLQGSIDNLKNYIYDRKISKFTEAQDFLQKAIETNKLVTLGVAKQALIDGYSPPQ